jgi:hypothetical protein
MKLLIILIILLNFCGVVAKESFCINSFILRLLFLSLAKLHLNSLTLYNFQVSHT